jgi:hypothetical protein
LAWGNASGFRAYDKHFRPAPDGSDPVKRGAFLGPVSRGAIYTRWRWRHSSCHGKIATLLIVFLAATAKVFGLTLASADIKLLGLGDIATLANR